MAQEYKQLTLSNFRAEKDFYTVREIEADLWCIHVHHTIMDQKGYFKGKMREPVTSKAKTMQGG